MHQTQGDSADQFKAPPPHADISRSLSARRQVAVSGLAALDKRCTKAAMRHPPQRTPFTGPIGPPGLRTGCDAAADRDGEAPRLTTAETKLGFSLKLLLWAVDRKRVADAVGVAGGGPVAEPIPFASSSCDV